MIVLYGCLWSGVILIAAGVTIRFFYPSCQSVAKSVELPAEKMSITEDATTKRVPLAILLIVMMILAVGCGVATWYYQTSWLNVAFLLATLAFLAIAALTDFMYYIIPNRYILGMVLARGLLSVVEILLLGWVTFFAGIVECIVTATIGMLFLLAVSKITRGGMGFGDIKLLGAVAFLCGLRAFIYALLLGMIICALFSVCMLLTKKKRMRDELPMAPFIYVGFAVAVVLGVC